jgi:fructokinase
LKYSIVQGLISKSAIAKRLGLVNVADPTIPEDSDALWELIANYLAQLCLDLTLVLSPEVIVLNGAILNQPKLLPLIQKSFTKLLNNYVDHPKLKSKFFFF